MAVAFSEKEKEFIMAKLKDVAKECLGKYGARKTTVDQLVEMTCISKGAFYNFYPSKEALFFAVIEGYQNSIIEGATNKFSTTGNVTIEGFAEIIYELYQNVKQSFLMNIIRNQEFDYLMRKLPDGLILEHHSFDDIIARKMFSTLNIKDGIDIGVITASLRAVFMCMLHVEEIGKKDFDRALKLLIRGLAQQIMEGVSDNE